MTIKDYKIQPLFAIPYFTANIGYAISGKQIAYIQKLEMVKSQVNLISENLYIFEEPELQSIKVAVHEALDLYASEVMGIEQKLYVTQSWSLINYPNIGMHSHSHSNSIISGSLYYCDMPSPISRMIFERHNTYQQLELNPERDKQNIYNTRINMITPKKNDVVLFSSGLQHLVESNGASEPRHSIAFNCFIKGKIGNHRDVSTLEL